MALWVSTSTWNISTPLCRVDGLLHLQVTPRPAKRSRSSPVVSIFTGSSLSNTTTARTRNPGSPNIRLFVLAVGVGDTPGAVVG